MPRSLSKSLLFLCHSIVPPSSRGLSDEHKKRETLHWQVRTAGASISLPGRRETPRSLVRRREKPSSHVTQGALSPRRLEKNGMASRSVVLQVTIPRPGV